MLPRTICAPMLGELVRRHRLDRAVGADRHEHRRLDGAVRESRAGRARARPDVACSVNCIAAIVAARSAAFGARVAGRQRPVALEQHRVAVAEEAVALRDRVRVGGANRRRSRRTRETSISSVDFGRWKLVQQPVDDAEAVARRDEERGFGFAGAHAPGVVGRRFERAQAGRADGDDAAAARARRVDRGGGRRPECDSARRASGARRDPRFRPAGTCRRRRAA